MNTIEIIKKWEDTNSVAFECEGKMYLYTLPPSDKIMELGHDQLIERLEQYIEEIFIRKVA